MKRKGKVMKRGKIIVSSLIMLVIVLSCMSVSDAGMVEIKEISFSFDILPYYSNPTLGFSQGTSLVADVAIPTGPATVDWAYTIRNAVVTLSDMDKEPGSTATTGIFGGPATLTVEGNLVSNATSTDLTGNVILFEAVMDSSELIMSEIFSEYCSGGAVFTTSGGLLKTGVADPDAGNTVFLEEFGMGLWGYGGVVNFDASSMTPDEAGVLITTDAVPEPATLGLLSMGLVILSRKRKNT